MVLRTINHDEPPAFLPEDVHDAIFYNFDDLKISGVQLFILNNLTNFTAHQVNSVADTIIEKSKKKEL